MRKYGSQLTVDLNFPFLLSSLASHGIPAQLEQRKEYAEQALGFPLTLRELKGGGLDYAPLRTKASTEPCPIEEDDGFCHLRIGR